MTSPAYIYKVGDIVVVTEDHNDSWTTDPTHYDADSTNSSTRLKKGEELQIKKVNESGKLIGYKSAGNNLNYVPIHKVRLKITMPYLITTETREEPEITITTPTPAHQLYRYKVGDWVEIVDPPSDVLSPHFIPALFVQLCKEGEKARIRKLDGHSSIQFYSFWNSYQCIPTNKVRPTEAPTPPIYLFITILTFIGALNMRSLIELMNADPIIRNAVHAVCIAGATYLASSMTYMTGKTFLTGFGKIGDRRRRIRQEEEDREEKGRQDMIRIAIEEAKKRG